MKYWQYFFLLAAIYLAPHTSEIVAIGIGCVFFALGFIAKWHDE